MGLRRDRDRPLRGGRLGRVRFLWRRSLGRVAFGVLLLVVSVVLPFFLYYGRFIGTAAAVIGAALAGLQLFRKVGWGSRVAFLGLIAFIVIEPAASAFIGNLQESESFDRCEADVAVRTVDADRARQGRYPADFYNVYGDSDRYQYQSSRCPLDIPINWLYRVDRSGYTVGYFRDWGIGTHVCLHSSGQSGWTCGLNSWGPFPPQKEKPLPPQRPA